MPESEEKFHETVIDFVEDMLEYNEHSGMDAQYAWNCLGSLKKFFLQNGNYADGKKCTTEFSKMHVDETSRRSEQNCHDLFTSMEKYEDFYGIKSGSEVTKAFNVIHPFLKNCHKIKKESQVISNEVH